MCVCGQEPLAMLNDNKLAVTDKSTSGIDDPPGGGGPNRRACRSADVESTVATLAKATDDFAVHRPLPGDLALAQRGRSRNRRPWRLQFFQGPRRSLSPGSGRHSTSFGPDLGTGFRTDFGTGFGSGFGRRRNTRCRGPTRCRGWRRRRRAQYPRGASWLQGNASAGMNDVRWSDPIPPSQIPIVEPESKGDRVQRISTANDIDVASRFCREGRRVTTDRRTAGVMTTARHCRGNECAD